MRAAAKIFVQLLLTCALAASAAATQCAFTLTSFGANNQTSTINYVPLGYEPFANTLGAIDVWAFGCAGSGGGYPTLTTSDTWDNNPTTMNVYVRYLTGNSTSPDGRCGYTTVQLDPTTYAITGGMITMFQFDGQGNSCEGSMVDLVAHEIGHTLGLEDAYGISGCSGTIMGSSPSYVSSDQCDVVNNNWYTPEEYTRDHINDTCYQQCRGQCYDGRCDTDECFQIGTEWSPGCYSPILVDLAGSGFHLTSGQGGVTFDMNADGTPDLTAWTRNGDNAFLCLDRNHNSVIDDGKELFGNHTPLSTGGTAINGYEALADFDSLALGGNGDAWIDSQDGIWPFLRLWADQNHNGISEPSELLTLDAAGVVRIDTHYYSAHRRDQYGNQFRLRGRVVMHGQKHDQDHMTYDVFFVTARMQEP